MYYYSITIKCNKKDEGNDRDEIQSIYDHIIECTQSVNLKYTFELDSWDKLHLHGYFQTSNKLVYKHLKKKGWNIYLRRVYQSTGWFTYLMKDVELSREITDDLVKRIRSGAYCFRN